MNLTRSRFVDNQNSLNPIIWRRKYLESHNVDRAINPESMKLDIKISTLKAAVDALELAIKNNSVNKADATILAARITGYGIDTPPEPGPSLKIYDQTFLPAKGEAGKGVVA